MCEYVNVNMAENTTKTKMKTIRCTVVYYQRGKTGDQYNEKENILLSVPTDIGSVRKLEEIVRFFYYHSAILVGCVVWKNCERRNRSVNAKCEFFPCLLLRYL